MKHFLTGIMLVLVFTLGAGVKLLMDGGPKYRPADDGTPCYTYQGAVTCDFKRRAQETCNGVYPYATEGD